MEDVKQIETASGKKAEELNREIQNLKRFSAGPRVTYNAHQQAFLKVQTKVLASVRPRSAQGVMRIALQIPASKSRRARMPFPPTEMPEIYSYSLVASLAGEIYQTFNEDPVAYPCGDGHPMIIHLPDVQGHLQEQISAVQKLLQLPGNFDLWQFCSPSLVAAVRNHAISTLCEQRRQFIEVLQSKTRGSTPLINRTVVALAWATIVESRC